MEVENYLLRETYHKNKVTLNLQAMGDFNGMQSYMNDNQTFSSDAQMTVYGHKQEINRFFNSDPNATIESTYTPANSLSTMYNDFKNH